VNNSAIKSLLRGFDTVQCCYYLLPVGAGRAARTVEDARLLALRKELDRTTKGLDRLYEAVEQGNLPMDDTLRSRAQA
jgi:hypothetical protein